MAQEYYIVGENIDGDFIEFWYEGDLDACIEEARRELELENGGHLDIFIEHTDHDEFIIDVEV